MRADFDNENAEFTSFDGTAKVSPDAVFGRRMSDFRRQKLRDYAKEMLKRQIEPTKLYEPMPEQERFHKSNAKTRIVRGSNRAGKTLVASMECALIVSRRHPYLKYPPTGRLIAVGPDEKHIGHTMWDKLVNPIPKLRMIRDEFTRQWRVYRHWTDKHREKDARGMMPLIPERLIEHIAYRDKGVNCPSVVKLKTGWEIMFFTGGSNPPRGLDADVAWFDEEVSNPEFHREIMARLVDRAGKFFWSATPQTGGQSMWDIHLSCEEYARQNLEQPPSEEFVLTIDGNRYLDPVEVASLKETYRNDPEAYRVRIGGEYLITSFRVYPTFNEPVHVCDPIHIGDEWARFLSIDPGHVTTSVLFWAVPPDGKHAYIYDELYLRDTNDSDIAEKVKHKAMGHNFQSFIMDYHGSIRTEMGGLTIGQQISEQFNKQGLRSNTTGNGFYTPQGSIESGLSKVREWMAPTEDGKPFLQIFNGCADNLVRELKRYHKKRVKGNITDAPEQNGFHAVDALRYAAVHGLKYHKPRKENRILNPVLAWRKARRKKRSSAVVLGHTSGIS
jgi:hypothetical protein